MDEIGTHLSDEQAMQLAMKEAIKGAGFVSPNPLVGCVILDSHNRLLSTGYHEKYGGPHAEIQALSALSKNSQKSLAEQLDGARVFVTLEPCAHEGKTPSCAKRLAVYSIKEVIYGLVDPNPLVSGKGALILEQAGIKATLFGKRKEDLESVCEHFLMNFRRNRPFVSIKVASSLDGQMALKTGESKWITGEEAREYGRFLRGSHDATLVGINTIVMDDPELNIRHKKFPEKQNKVIVLDPAGKIFDHPKLKLFKVHKPENLIVIVENPKIQSNQAKVLVVQTTKDRTFVLNELLTKLGDFGIRSLLVEGGAKTISSFIMQKEANRLYLFQAPLILGGISGMMWSEQVRIESMKNRISIGNPQIKKFGQDLLISGTLT